MMIEVTAFLDDISRPEDVSASTVVLVVLMAEAALQHVWLNSAHVRVDLRW